MMSRLRACATSLQALRGWKRSLAAYLLGVLAMFTLPPFYLFPLLIPAFSGLYLLVDAAPTRWRMFKDGWFWGWGYYMCGLYWFCIALLTDAEAFAWLIPFALFGLTGVIAIYSGVACWLMAFVKKHSAGPGRILAFAGVYTLIELARGHLFTGFPWNLPGYSLGYSLASLQLASLIGIYGLTFVAVLLAVSPVLLLHAHPRNTGRLALGILWAAYAATLLWGYARIPEGPTPATPGVKLRLVQANIAQNHKWDPALVRQGMEEHIRLMHAPGLEAITHIIWPETAVPYVFMEHTGLAKALAEALPAGKYLVTGTLRADSTDYKTMHIWNSLIALSHEGAIKGSYDKAHLVPFGEFQPLRSFVPKEWMTPVGEKDFSWGIASQTLDWPGLPPMLPLICYEAIFPEMAEANTRPAWLLNVTNDAWFGLSTGPRQHFEMARLRAVEQGVSLVRVANTGISAVVDPYGRITASLPLGTQGILDSELPSGLENPTIYYKYHRVGLPLLFLLMAGLTLRRRKP